MPTVTLSALQSRVYARLDTSPLGLYPVSQVTLVLNEGLRRLNMLIGWKMDTVAVPGFTQANTLVYTVPDTLTIPTMVWCEKRALRKISLARISQQFKNWITDTNLTAGPISRWVPIGLTKFAIHPQDSADGRLLEVTGIAKVTPLVGANDTVDIEDEWADALVDYALSRIRLKEGGTRFASDSIIYNQLVSKIKPALLWQSMKFHAYFVSKETEPAQGRGT